MTIDAIATESQFLDHLAPVWRALPAFLRGRFLVHQALMERAKTRGIDAEPLDVAALMLATPVAPKPVPGADQPALVAAAGDIKIGRRLGYGPFAFIEHGAGQSYSGHKDDQRHGSYAGGPDRDDVGVFLVPNEPCAGRWRSAYPGARVEVVGSPRLADLPSRVPGPGPTVALSFHWPAPLNISGYAGTALGDFLPVLPRIAREFSVIGHAHPKGDWPQRMERQYARLGIPFVREFDDVCRQADVYVCDNSSTIFEFAATGRPVVLLNGKYWDKRQSHGLRFWEAAHVGIQVDAPGTDIVEAIWRALENRPEDIAAREDALSIVYAHREDATYRAAKAVVDWLASRVEVAA